MNYLPPILQKFKVQLKDLDKFELILFGSHADFTTNPKSDIDIAVITRNKNQEENKTLYMNLLKKNSSQFDINVFELLPLHVQASVIDNYQVIYGDSGDISEYFYSFRKKWDDCKGRFFANQFYHYREKEACMKRGNRILKKIGFGNPLILNVPPSSLSVESSVESSDSRCIDERIEEERIV